MHSANKGYTYQDILTATIIADNLDNETFKISQEKSEFPNDKFDDIIFYLDKRKYKLQVKHSDVCAEITERSFKNRSSNLNLEQLEPNSKIISEVHEFIVASNRPLKTSGFFKQKKSSFPCSIFDHSWKIQDDKQKRNKDFIDSLRIIPSLPDASFDLMNPGELEKHLLFLLRTKVGVGTFPNHDTQERDAATRLIMLATKMRLKKDEGLMTAEDIRSSLDLNFEYGHIPQLFPFTPAEFRIHRKDLVQEVIASTKTSQVTVLTGGPGSGKSHVFDDVSETLNETSTIVLKHYCYLEPTDDDQQVRVLIDTLFGNFTKQLEDQCPKLFQNHYPRYAATKKNFESLLAKLEDDGKNCVLMIDGFDHVDRVVTQNNLPTDTVNLFLQYIFNLKIPPNCSILIFSQPNRDLFTFAKKVKANSLSIASWNKKEVGVFVERFGVRKQTAEEVFNELVDFLFIKTEGNPLYLTYILNSLKHPNKNQTIIDQVNEIPDFGGDLNNYYRFLIKNFDDRDKPIIVTLALLEFGVTKKELRSMFHHIEKRYVDKVIDQILPILKPGFSQIGIRIYHESFKRYIIEKEMSSSKAVYDHIIQYLEKKQFYSNQISYRYLIGYLVKGNHPDKIKDLFDSKFLSLSLYFFQPIKSIFSNLAQVSSFAASRSDWGLYIKTIELKKGLNLFIRERDYLFDDYHNALIRVHGAKSLVHKLSFDGEAIFSATEGLRLCAKIEHLGGKPPWGLYSVAGKSMSLATDQEVREFLEISSIHFLKNAIKLELNDGVKLFEKKIRRHAFVGQERFFCNLLLREFDFIYDLRKNYNKLLAIKTSKRKRSILYEMIAEFMLEHGNKQQARRVLELVETVDDRNRLNLIRLNAGLKIQGSKPKDLVSKTRTVFDFERMFDDESLLLKEWYSEVEIAARLSKKDVLLLCEELSSQIDGWYKAWIIFVIKLSYLEIQRINKIKKSEYILKILKELAEHAHPFHGSLRAMDLYKIFSVTCDSFKRSLHIVSGSPVFDDVLKTLSHISIRTSSSLQGAVDGPLSGERLNFLLASELAPFNEREKKKLLKLIEMNIESEVATSDYYDTSAEQYFELATILADQKKIKAARSALFRACERVVAYGQRKDGTLFELIDPLTSIGEKNENYAISTINRLYPLIEIATHRTDGKTTRWFLNHLLDHFIDIDLNTALVFFTKCSEVNLASDWRWKGALESLCEKLLSQSVDPILILKLFETIPYESSPYWTPDTGLKIARELFNAGKNENGNHLVHSLAMHLFLIYRTERFVSENENYKKLLEIIEQENVLSVPDWLIEIFKNEWNESQASTRPTGIQPNRELTTKPNVVRLSFAKKTPTELCDYLADYELDIICSKTNLGNFIKALNKLQSAKTLEVIQSLRKIFRKGVYQSEVINQLRLVMNALAQKGDFDAAAVLGMLCFVHIRGGGGWYLLSDTNTNDFGAKALELSNGIADSTLRTELTYLAVNSEYGAGITKHLIVFLNQFVDPKKAMLGWEAAYEIISSRLPETKENMEEILKCFPQVKKTRARNVEKNLMLLIKSRR